MTFQGSYDATLHLDIKHTIMSNELGFWVIWTDLVRIRGLHFSPLDIKWGDHEYLGPYCTLRLPMRLHPWCATGMILNFEKRNWPSATWWRTWPLRSSAFVRFTITESLVVSVLSFLDSPKIYDVIFEVCSLLWSILTTAGPILGENDYEHDISTSPVLNRKTTNTKRDFR